MKDQHDNKTQDWLEVTMPLEVAVMTDIEKAELEWASEKA